jgi:N-acetylglucosamine-6-sulfatase
MQHHSIRVFLTILTLVVTSGFVACQSSKDNADGAPAVSLARARTRPNIIVVVVDDLRWDELGVTGHPYLETPNIDRLAHEGALLTNAFHAVPLCSPNRASILTGQYPSRHGIIDNVARNQMSHRLRTYPQALQQAGYETGFLGKWHMGNDPTPRPGFDYWVAIPGQGNSENPELYEDGRLHTVDGYLTDVLTDRAVDFIGRDREKPFCLYIGHKAMHPDIPQRDVGYIPAPRHRGRYEKAVFPRRPNVVEDLAGLADRPAVQRAVEARRSPEIQELFKGVPAYEVTEEAIRGRAEMLLAVDDGIGRIMDALDQAGISDDTAILFTGDNGFWYGEHGLTIERRLPYEEGIRMPLLIRYPGLTQAESKIDELVVSVDIAPTVLDLAQAPIGDHIQGRSFVPLLTGATRDWRDSFLVEFYTYEQPMPWLVDMDYRAVRTERYKYIHWMQHPDENELYDLVEDPYEKKNLIHEEGMADVLAEMKQRLRELALQATGLAE